MAHTRLYGTGSVEIGGPKQVAVHPSCPPLGGDSNRDLRRCRVFGWDAGEPLTVGRPEPARHRARGQGVDQDRDRLIRSL